MKKLLLVTDAWEPQTNGVVTTLQQVTRHLPEFGFEARVVHPGQFEHVPLPSYPEIRISRNPWKLREILERERPDACHVATEGPLGLYARSLFRRRGIPFTTSLHTKFPEYVHQRIRVPLGLGYAFIRWFHRPAERTLCTTESLRRELLGWGLSDLVVWSRGVDADHFRPSSGRRGGNRGCLAGDSDRAAGTPGGDGNPTGVGTRAGDGTPAGDGDSFGHSNPAGDGNSDRGRNFARDLNRAKDLNPAGDGDSDSDRNFAEDFKHARDLNRARDLNPAGDGDFAGDGNAGSDGKSEGDGSAAQRRPRLLYVGRIAVEKNVEAFLDLDLDADKVMVGDGPQRAELEARYPEALWLGYRKGQPLIDEYAAADAFVFPSRTDTFGLVMLEALACGTPVAAYPVTGPRDVVRQGVTGWLDEDLKLAVRRALRVSREDCRAYAVANGWPKIARTLAENLAVFDPRQLDGR